MIKKTVPIKGKVVFQVVGFYMDHVELRIISKEHGIVVNLSGESLLELMDQFYFAVESVISRLN